MEKLISINVDIKVNNKEKLKCVIKRSLLGAASIGALIGAMSVRIFYNSGIPIFLLIFALSLASAFCASSVIESVKHRGAAALCGIPICAAIAAYQVYNVLSRVSNNPESIILPCVITVGVCVLAAVINAVGFTLISKRK